MIELTNYMACCVDHVDNLNIKILNTSSDGKSIDAVVQCGKCGNKKAVVDSVLINCVTVINKEKIANFNQKYAETIHLGEITAPMVAYIENVQWKPGLQGFISIIKKSLNACFYFIFYIYIFFYCYCWLFFKRRQSYSNAAISKIIHQLASSYCYVPEMAIHKLLEIKVLKESLPEKRLGVVLDIGGGGGDVFNVLFEGYEAIKKINIDLYASRTDYYDFHLSEDVTSSCLGSKTIDKIVSISVLEHIPNIKGVFEFANRVLKDDGVLLFTTPREDYYKSLVLVRFLKIFSKKAAMKYANYDIKHAFHCSLYSKEIMIGKLKEAGFNTVEAIPFFSNKSLGFFDLLNITAKLPVSWHFWGGLNSFLNKHSWLKRKSIKILERFLIQISTVDDYTKHVNAADDAYTQYLYVAKK